MLFLVYTNDISAELSPGRVIRMFADVSLLYRTISSPGDSSTLQKDRDTLQIWETANKMEFHPRECETNPIQIKADFKIHLTILVRLHSILP